ncbi:MAG: polymer-forming cytoskeletal protein [Bacteroidales bacterium]|nr:polymer-forming cytoskeletal protein [Bacteroidales bacterium]
MAEKNSSQQAHAHEITRIPVGTELRAATLLSEKDVRIDGSFIGDIFTSGKLIIGETGHLCGNICCKNADIYGRIDGDVIIGDTLMLQSTCVFKGLLQTHKLSVESGARFNGTCKIITQEEYQKMEEEFKGSSPEKETPKDTETPKEPKK